MPDTCPPACLLWNYEVRVREMHGVDMTLGMGFHGITIRLGFLWMNAVA
jgi:hypothetical protein